MPASDFRTIALLLTIGTLASVAAGAAVVRADARVARDPGLARLARVGTVLSAAVWVLLVFGSSVRANGAGLACPDWPRCFGEIVPAIDWPVFLEFGHRVYAGCVSLVFVGLGIASLRRPDLRARMFPWFVGAAVALGAQIVLGGLTVWNLLAEWTVASHLLCGNAFSALIAIIALELRDAAAPVRREGVTPAARFVGALLIALVVAQVALGGLVSSSHAGLACGTWPGCNGTSWFPSFEGVVGLQVMHRITAYTLVSVGLFALLVTRGRGTAGAPTLAIAGIVVAQATIGVLNVLLRLPVEVTLLHSAGAGALVIAIAWFNHAAWRAPLAVHSADSRAIGLAEAR